MADADRCVMCGEVIPEGSHICKRCEKHDPKPNTLYAIQHRETGKFITGTDFRYPHYRQIINEYHAPLLLTGYDILHELKRRNVNMKRYRVVAVNVEVVK